MRSFQNVVEAEAWYAARVEAEGRDEDRILLAISRGEYDRAEALLRKAAFPNRFQANLVYLAGHYLLYLGRRDRLRQAARTVAPGLALPEPGADPWRDLEAIARAIERRLRESPGDLRLHYLLGHAYLSMEYHEAAEAAYRRALATAPDDPVPWDNPNVLGPLREGIDGVPAPS